MMCEADFKEHMETLAGSKCYSRAADCGQLQGAYPPVTTSLAASAFPGEVQSGRYYL